MSTRKISREEILSRTRRVLKALWEALEIHQEVPREVSNALVPKQKDSANGATIWPPREGQEAVVELEELDWPFKKVCFKSMRSTFPVIYLTGYRTGRVVVEFGEFFLAQERAIFSCYSPDLAKEELKDLRIFRPLLRALGLEDLEEALEVLLTLEDGAIRRIGPYTLVRARKLLALHRGKLFGDLALDAKLLTGEPVTLRYPNGIEVVFEPSGTFVLGWPALKSLRLLWEEGEFFCETEFPYCKEAPKGEPFNRMFSFALKTGVQKKSSLRMEILIEELKKHRFPLRELEKPRLLQEVCLKALSL